MIIPFLTSGMGDLSKCGTLAFCPAHPTQGELGARSSSPRRGQSDSLYGQRPATGSSPKYQEPTFFSFPPDPRILAERWPVERSSWTLVRKRGPSVPHIYPFCPLEGGESWSPSGGNTDTAGGGGKEASVSLDPAAGSPHTRPASSHGYHEPLPHFCLAFHFPWWMAVWVGIPGLGFLQGPSQEGSPETPIALGPEEQGVT